MNDNDVISLQTEIEEIENIFLLSKTLNDFHCNNDNSDFDFLFEELLKFRKLKVQNIDNNISIPYIDFQTKTFSHLEALLTEAVLLLQKNERDSKIKKIMEWFTKTFSTVNSLAQMKSKTAKDTNQIFKEEEVVIPQQLYKTDHDIDEEHKKHRDNIDKFKAPSLELKKYITKVVFPPKIVKDLKTKDSNFGNNSDKDNEKVIEKINSEIQSRSTSYATQTSSTFYKINKIGLGQSIIDQDKCSSSRFDPSKEVKSYYSYNRPKYEFHQLIAERNMNDYKHKYIAELRYLTEINEAVKEFGLNKALFRQRLNKTKEMNEMLTTYRNVIKENHKKVKDNLQRVAKEKKLQELLEHEKSKEELRRQQMQEDQKEEELQLKETFENEAQLQKQQINKESFNEIIKEKKVDNITLPKITISNVKYITPLQYSNDKVIIIKCKITRFTILDMNNIEMIRRNIEEKDNGNLTELNLPSDIKAYTDRSQKKLKYRAFNSGLCNLKIIDNSKDSYKKSFIPLSLFDTANKHILIKPKGRNHGLIGRDNLEFLYDSYRKNNHDYLNLRKTITSFNESKMKCFNHKRNLSLKHTIRNAFAHPDHYNTVSPLSHLPKTGSALLCLPS